MLSAIYYPGGCAASQPAHFCSDCSEAEHGRVRSIAFIAKDFTITDPSDPTEWAAGVAAGKIIIIPAVIGSYNGGDPVTGTGYGDVAEKLNGYNFELTFKDPNYAENADFYNALKNSRNYRVAFRSENLTHMSDKAVSVIPKNPITDNLNDEVVWDVTVKFQQSDLPTPFDTPEGIFDTCFDYS